MVHSCGVDTDPASAHIHAFQGPFEFAFRIAACAELNRGPGTLTTGHCSSVWAMGDHVFTTAEGNVCQKSLVSGSDYSVVKRRQYQGLTLIWASTACRTAIGGSQFRAPSTTAMAFSRPIFPGQARYPITTDGDLCFPAVQFT